jgi:hypothetical protein
VSCEAESSYYTEETAAATIIANGTYEVMQQTVCPSSERRHISDVACSVSTSSCCVNVIAVSTETWQELNTYNGTQLVTCVCLSVRVSAPISGDFCKWILITFGMSTHVNVFDCRCAVTSRNTSFSRSDPLDPSCPVCTRRSFPCCKATRV